MIAAIMTVILTVEPDILVLTDFDHDFDGIALKTFADKLADQGLSYPHRFAPASNTGLLSGADLNRDGRLNTPEDAHGFGRFSGDGAMAILSRTPITEMLKLDEVLWQDIPHAPMPLLPDGSLWPEDLRQVQRISTSGHWVIESGGMSLLAFSATPPVFDGEEDFNGLRGAAELYLWSTYLDEQFGPVPDEYIIIGLANIDPEKGDGRQDVMRDFLSDPRLQDLRPTGTFGLNTGNWPDGPGQLRVDYALPSATLDIAETGVAWPQDPLSAGAHGLVWLDIRTDPG